MVHYKTLHNIIFGFCVQGARGAESHYAYVNNLRRTVIPITSGTQASWIRAVPTSWTNGNTMQFSQARHANAEGS